MTNLTRYKLDLLNSLTRFKNEIHETRYFKKILAVKWFQETETQIKNLKEEEDFSPRTHPLFIKYMQEEFSQIPLNIVQKLDRYYGFIQAVIGNHRIKNLREKIKRIGDRDFANYRGTVYEIIILGIFAEYNYLKEIEPSISGVRGRFEATIEIDNQEIFIEATTLFPKEEFMKVGNIRQISIEKFYKKIIEKIDKFESIDIPVLLFVNASVSKFHKPEIWEGIEKIEEYANFKFITALVISSYYYAKDNLLFINRRNPRYPLDCNVYHVLRDKFKLRDLKPWDYKNKK